MIEFKISSKFRLSPEEIARLHPAIEDYPKHFSDVISAKLISGGPEYRVGNVYELIYKFGRWEVVQQVRVTEYERAKTSVIAMEDKNSVGISQQSMNVVEGMTEVLTYYRYNLKKKYLLPFEPSLARHMAKQLRGKTTQINRLVMPSEEVLPKVILGRCWGMDYRLASVIHFIVFVSLFYQIFDYLL